jgi:hypothetical protein
MRRPSIPLVVIVAVFFIGYQIVARIGHEARLTHGASKPAVCSVDNADADAISLAHCESAAHGYQLENR